MIYIVKSLVRGNFTRHGWCQVGRKQQERQVGLKSEKHRVFSGRLCLLTTIQKILKIDPAKNTKKKHFIFLRVVPEGGEITKTRYMPGYGRSFREFGSRKMKRLSQIREFDTIQNAGSCGEMYVHEVYESLMSKNIHTVVSERTN